MLKLRTLWLAAAIDYAGTLGFGADIPEWAIYGGRYAVFLVRLELYRRGIKT